MTAPLTIRFTRARDGKIASAVCATPQGELRVNGGYDVTVKGRKGKVEGQDGVIYRMIVKLADSGWVGHDFEAHDGRMVCLQGVIDKKSVPVRYGGEKRE